jgi:DNA-binding protein
MSQQLLNEQAVSQQEAAQEVDKKSTSSKAADEEVIKASKSDSGSKKDEPLIDPFELNIARASRPYKVISQLIARFRKGQVTVKLSAIGNAINNAATISNTVRVRVGDLHMIIDSSNIIHTKKQQLISEKDGDKTVEEKETQRNLVRNVFTISKEPLDTDHIGY